MNAFLHHFLHMLAEAFPLFLLGAAVGAALEVWVPHGWIERWLASGRSSLAIATTAGALLPGCAMSTIPIASALGRRGTPLGTVAAFLMIAPLLSPHTIVLTATLVNLPMAGARLVLSFLAAFALGLTLNAAQRRGWIFSVTAPAATTRSREEAAVPTAGGGCSAEMAKAVSCCDAGADCGGSAGNHETAQPGWRRWLRRFLGTLRELLPFLVAGLAAAAVLMAVVPVERLEAHLRGGWLAYAITTLIAIPTYVCDGGEIPLTRALLALGVGAGPAFCFMMASVGTCLPTIAIAGRIIGWRATAIYLAAWLLLAIGGGLLVETLPGQQP